MNAYLYFELCPRCPYTPKKRIVIRTRASAQFTEEMLRNRFPRHNVQRYNPNTERRA